MLCKAGGCISSLIAGIGSLSFRVEEVENPTFHSNEKAEQFKKRTGKTNKPTRGLSVWLDQECYSFADVLFRHLC